MIESGIDYRELYKAEKEKNADLLAKVSEQQREIDSLKAQVEKLKAIPIEILGRLKSRLSDIITSDIHLVEKWEIDKLIKELENDNRH